MSSARLTNFRILPSWKPSESFDHNLRKISRDDYLTIVAVFGSLSGLVQGFLTTLSGMMLMDEAFLDDMGRYDSTFADRFIMLFFAGEIIGSMLSFPFSDTFGRKTTLIYASVVCILAIIWNSLTTSGADFLTARFFVGWTMGLLISTSPVYASEIAMTRLATLSSPSPFFLPCTNPFFNPFKINFVHSLHTLLPSLSPPHPQSTRVYHWYDGNDDHLRIRTRGCNILFPASLSHRMEGVYGDAGDRSRHQSRRSVVSAGVTTVATR